MKYIAKKDTWFDERTEVKLIDDYREEDPKWNFGLFEGMRGGKIDEETCPFDEFYLVGWININENHPDSDTYVLVCLNEKFIKTSYYFEDSFGRWFSTDYDIWDKEYTEFVTHWTPLPELPELI